MYKIIITTKMRDRDRQTDRHAHKSSDWVSELSQCEFAILVFSGLHASEEKSSIHTIGGYMYVINSLNTGL